LNLLNQVRQMKGIENKGSEEYDDGGKENDDGLEWGGKRRTRLEGRAETGRADLTGCCAQVYFKGMIR
jgi:hypothetical protein